MRKVSGLSLLDTILNRRSVRRYRSELVPEQVLTNILEAGRAAPSANNAQPWHFIVVTDPKIKHALSQRRWTGFVADSAFTVVGCGESGNKWSTVDVTIALENMVLAAEAQGLGSCWVGDFKESEVKNLLSIPDRLKVVALVAFGYPAEKPYPRGKKSLKEIVHYNRF
ncbi:MAG: nitroreductase family protein [Candidatus Bathyarchaeota archaeon]|nr:nitroreductase family protein [Candidatus Bathyarchaeota archaeon]